MSTNMSDYFNQASQFPFGCTVKVKFEIPDHLKRILPTLSDVELFKVPNEPSIQLTKFGLINLLRDYLNYERKRKTRKISQSISCYR